MLGRGRFSGLLADKASLDSQIRLFLEVLREITQGPNANRSKSKSPGELSEPAIVMLECKYDIVRASRNADQLCYRTRLCQAKVPP